MLQIGIMADNGGHSRQAGYVAVDWQPVLLPLRTSAIFAESTERPNTKDRTEWKWVSGTRLMMRSRLTRTQTSDQFLIQITAGAYPHRQKRKK